MTKLNRVSNMIGGGKLEELTTALAETANDLKQRSINVRQAPYNAKGNALYYNETDRKWYADAGFTELSTDDTSAIQAAIDALPPSGTVTGVNASFLVQSLYLKSDMNMENFKFVSKEGAVMLQSPVTIGAWHSSDVRKNIRVKNVHVNGNRTNQTALSTSEDGGRHGFRLIGLLENIVIENSSAIYCGSDGIEMYRGMGVDPVYYDTGIKRNIRVVNSVFNWNRRHGGSGDSMSDVKFIECEFKYNGRDVNGGLTEGDKGAISFGKTYGNGFDMEEYGVRDFVGDITFKGCDMRQNVRAGILFYSGLSTKSDDANFVPRKGIYLDNCKIDSGISDHIYAIEITPTTINAQLGKYYKSVFITDCQIEGRIMLRAVDDVLISGGSLVTDISTIGVLDTSSNVQVGDIKRQGKVFYTSNSDVKYPLEYTPSLLFPDGVKTSDIFTVAVGTVKTFALPNTRASLLALAGNSPSRSGLVAIGEAAVAYKMSGWSEIETSNVALTGSTGLAGKLTISFLNGVLYIENRFTNALAYSITILGD